jgi:NAD(P)-dependent dehydrogenase (short-subunit alcohol dehydrogenase family)
MYLVESGALQVAFVDRNESGAREAAKTSKRYATNLNCSTVASHAEITNVESVQMMVDVVPREHGGIDYPVHGVGEVLFTAALAMLTSLNWL